MQLTECMFPMLKKCWISEKYCDTVVTWQNCDMVLCTWEAIALWKKLRASCKPVVSGYFGLLSILGLVFFLCFSSSAHIDFGLRAKKVGHMLHKSDKRNKPHACCWSNYIAKTWIPYSTVFNVFFPLIAFFLAHAHIDLGKSLDEKQTNKKQKRGLTTWIKYHAEHQ